MKLTTLLEDDKISEEGTGRELSPDTLYERQWALGVLKNALVALRHECESARFAILEPVVSGERTDEGYIELASQLGLTVSGVKGAVRRLRQRYGELLRAEVAETVGNREEIEAELRYLQHGVDRRAEFGGGASPRPAGPDPRGRTVAPGRRGGRARPLARCAPSRPQTR